MSATPAPRWHASRRCASKEEGSILKLHNSLTDEKVPFYPSRENGSKLVSWYICGPTVYDSAHVGHARNYVTFDIVRRILEDYFGYDVLYVMNVTDIDDKIILRARRNHLLEKYKEEHGKDFDRIRKDCMDAVIRAVEKQEAATMESVQAAADETDPKRKEELEVVAKQEALKSEKVLASQRNLEEQVRAGCIAGMIEASSDALAVMLDTMHGGQVTDHSIFKSHAAKYEEEFMEDMKSLGVRPPTVLTRVSEYMEEIVEYVEKIISNGLGYVANGSVYFDTQAFQQAGHRYGKLRPWAVGSSSLAAEGEVGGEFATTEKRHPNDFALWKASKPGEPSWSSPWGNGRPGWHIECSAMASSILGMNIDIHTGGEDLKFPHHDNELAQAEAYFHCEGCNQWVNYFLHSGHLGIEGLKMSKSLKNFVTIRQALEETSARQLRLLFVMQPWDRPMSYSTTTMSEVKAREAVLKNFYQNTQVARRAAEKAGHASCKRWGSPELELNNALQEAQGRVHDRLLDNLDTRGAMDAICELIKQVNIYLSSMDSYGNLPQTLLLDTVECYITKILASFGITGDMSFAAVGASDNRDEKDRIAPLLDAFAAFRDEIRSMARSGGDGTGILAACDRLRDCTMVDLGVRLEDKTDGSVWKLDDPSTLRAEIEEKRKLAYEAERLKTERKVAAKAKEIAKWEKLSLSPKKALCEKYNIFDENENPTHDNQGVPLEGKRLEKAKKDADKIRRQQAQYLERLAEEPGFLDAMKEELSKLTALMDGMSTV